MASAHKYTQGSQMLKYLEDLLAKGKALDQKNLTVEQKILSKTPLTDEELATTSEDTSELTKLIKDGNKFGSLLNAWIRQRPES